MGVGITASDAGRRTAHEYVKDSLRRAILSGTLPGGTRLVQSDVASELGVSTTPVREAMRDLATEGLIRLDPHRGAIVHEMSWEEIVDIAHVLKLLEPEALRQAAKTITDDTLARAEELKDRLAAETDPALWAELNRQFFGVLVQDIGSRYLIDILRTLRDKAALYVGRAAAAHLIQAGDTTTEHEEFVAALRAGDAEVAAQLSAQYIDARLRIIRARLDTWG